MWRFATRTISIIDGFSGSVHANDEALKLVVDAWILLASIHLFMSLLTVYMLERRLITSILHFATPAIRSSEHPFPGPTAPSRPRSCT